ncbi:MAG TPA: hypothetical protein VKF63_08955 [Terracidiphilus sp.]|nr:hypothetical protein [Terracidiphilus sp.]
MKRFAVLALVLLLAGTLSAKEEPHQWKALQVKNLTVNPGVNLSPEEIGYFHEGFLEAMRKSKLAEQVLDDGATVPQDIASDSMVMEGTITYLEQGGAFRSPHAQAEFKLYRVSDHRLITTTTWQGEGLGHGASHGKAWKYIGIIAAYEVKKKAKELQPLSSFPPAAPAEAETPASVGTAQQVSSNADALTNNSIVEMVTAKLPEEVIITKIQTSPNNFDLSTPALADLNQKGVSAAIMKAMLTAPKAAAPAAPPVTTGQQGSTASASGDQANSFTGKLKSKTALIMQRRSSAYAKMEAVADDGQTLTFYAFASTSVTDASGNDLNKGGKYLGGNFLKKGQRIEVKYSVITNGSRITNGQYRADSIHALD